MSAKKSSRGVSPFRIVLAVLFALVCVLLVKLPGQTVDAEAEQEKLESAANAYWKAQEENNRLRSQLSESGTEDFVERVARREYGYCWYGETIYEVANLDELLASGPFDVYTGEEAGS